MKRRSMIKRIKKRGIFNVYETDNHGIIEIGVYTNPTIYISPGYYIAYNDRFYLPDALQNRCFRTSMQAVKNVCRFLNGYSVISKEHI